MPWGQGVAVPDLHPTFEKMVQRLECRSPLDQADRESLLGLPHNLKTMPANAHVVRDGEVPNYVALLLSGFAYRYKVTGAGARQILSFHGAAEFLDLQNSFLGVADHSVQMLTEGEIALIPPGVMEELALTRPGIARALWIDTLIDSAIFREWVVNVGRRDSRARIAHLLCEFSLRLEAAGLAKNHRYELPMTQEQLADAVGLTPVHVNRVLKQLAEEGLIRRDRRSIAILDWKRMCRAGDFNERYLHHDAMGAREKAA